MICSLQNTRQETDAVTGRRLVLGNADVRISYAWVGKTSPLYRNAVGDECVYVEDGTAVLETVFGRLPVSRGDYAIIPRATTHRWVVPEGSNARLYFIEANSHIGPATRSTSPNKASSLSTHRTANGTCAAPRSRCFSRARM